MTQIPSRLTNGGWYSEEYSEDTTFGVDSQVRSVSQRAATHSAVQVLLRTAEIDADRLDELDKLSEFRAPH